MGAVKPLDKQITHYLGHLNTQQKEVVLSVVKTIAGEEAAWWEDDQFIAEMDRRFDEMKNGKVKTYTLDEMEAKARLSYKNRKKKK
jgi:hypothetical protein